MILVHKPCPDRLTQSWIKLGRRKNHLW